MLRSIKICIQLLLFTILILANDYAIGQKTLDHPKRAFQSPEGKLFWPGNQPVYIRLSTSPQDTAQSFLMHSESTPEYADPYYFDTEGVNYIRTRWAVDQESKQPVYPQMEVLWEVYNDSYAPESQANLSQSGTFAKNEEIYASDQLKVALTARDEMSGVAAIYYSIDQSPYQEYHDVLSFAEEKGYHLKFYAVDQVGNVEKVQEKHLNIDVSVPVTSYKFEGPEKDQVVSGKTNISISSNDPASGVKTIFFQLDSGQLKAYKQPISLSHLSEGDHQLIFYAEDQLGNQEKPRQISFFIDNTPPIITSDLMGDSFITNGKEYSSGRSRVKITAIDNKSGIKNIYYALNEDEYQIYDKPFFISGQQGGQTIRYYAEDQVGNRSVSTIGSEGMSTPYLDLSGPALSYKCAGPTFKMRDTLFINSKTRISLSAKDQESGLKKITYSINQAEETDYEQPIQLNQPGFHKIDFFGYDQVNNSNRSSICIYVDNDGPEIIPVVSIDPVTLQSGEGQKQKVYAKHAVLFLSATDKVVGYESIFYSINDGKEELYTSAIKDFKGGNYQVQIKAIDKLGNEKLDLVSFMIED
ncbi:MAG: OmpL47-type beta-barrel domain-containing protein [Candidatus Cyclobacteriaceae bacterium M3_2C_046]